MNREGRSRTGQPTSVAAETLEPGAAGPGAADNGAADNGAADGGAADGRPADGGAAGSEPGRRTRIATVVRAGWRRVRSAVARPAARHGMLLVGYVAAGIAVTWPRAAYLTEGELPRTSDVASYVFGLYWVAHQVSHLGNPFFTTHMAAPVGLQLGFDTLMPLPGLVMTPVTLAFGPSASFSILTIVAPGLLCYVMYRAARLWLAVPGAIVAGAFFGLSTMLTWQNWYHLNISLGSLFLPMTLEAAIALRRRPAARTSIILGAVLGASVLVNQESAVLAVLLAAVVVVPWLVSLLIRDRAAVRARIGPLALGAVVAAVVAGPQLIAMAQQEIANGATAPANQLAQTYSLYGVGLPTLFSPSPRLATFGLGQLAVSQQRTTFGLGHLAASYSYSQPIEGVPTFGAILTLLALAGLVLGWRRRSSWWFALLWLAGAALALGPTLLVGSRTYLPLESVWHGVRVSDLLPYTWLVRIPGLSALREADRLAVLGLMGAAILAGYTAQWLSRRRVTRPALVAVLVLGALEVGWSPSPGNQLTMRTALPTLDQPIEANRSHSIVLDLPFGLRGGIPLYGEPIPTRALVMATADGHPRSISYTSWVPRPTVLGIEKHAFYRLLEDVQLHGATFTRPQLAAARADLRQMDISWVLIWRTQRPAMLNYLYETGYRYDYQVDGVTVLRSDLDSHR